MSTTKQIVLTALCVALGVVLPSAFHFVPNAGSVMLPMHIPVLIAGLVTGPVFGLLAGIITPALSSVITGMPPAAYLPGMLVELAVYGLVSGCLSRLIKTGKPVLDLYISLTGAMLMGRVFYGIINALILRAGSYSLEIWVTASFVTALPGIILQLLVIPPLILALKKARLID